MKSGINENESNYILKGKDKEMIDMVRKYVKNKDIEELRRLTEHKCFNCVWSKWTGTKFFCMFTRCIKGLRRINKK